MIKQDRTQAVNAIDTKNWQRGPGLNRKPWGYESITTATEFHHKPHNPIRTRADCTQSSRSCGSWSICSSWSLAKVWQGMYPKAWRLKRLSHCECGVVHST